MVRAFLDWFAERGWPVHAISLRGHGGSEGHEMLGQWGVDHYVADVMQVIDEIGEAPVLIGHSMGRFRGAEVSDASGVSCGGADVFRTPKDCSPARCR